MYNIYFMLRRFLIVITILFLHKFPYIQQVIFTKLSLMNLCYLIYQKPLEEGNENEIFNEGVIYLICILLLNFLNVAQPDDFRSLMGWVVIMIGGGNIFINMCLTIKGTIDDMLRERRKNQIVQEVVDKLEYATKKRLDMIKKYPD